MEETLPPSKHTAAMTIGGPLFRHYYGITGEKGAAWITTELYLILVSHNNACLDPHPGLHLRRLYSSGRQSRDPLDVIQGYGATVAFSQDCNEEKVRDQRKVEMTNRWEIWHLKMI